MVVLDPPMKRPAVLKPIPAQDREAPLLKPRDVVPTRCRVCHQPERPYSGRVYVDYDIAWSANGRAHSITCLDCGRTVAWLPMGTVITPEQRERMLTWGDGRPRRGRPPKPSRFYEGES